MTEASSSDPAEDVGLDWTGRKLMQDRIENHTLEPPRAGKIVIYAIYITLRRPGLTVDR